LCDKITYRFAPNVKQNMRILLILTIFLAFASAAFAQQTIKVGMTAPDFVVESTNGEVFDLQELKGKVVVITFWSTTCEICKTEIPNLNALTADYKDVVFLGMTTDQGDRLAQFLNKKPFKFNIIQNSFGIFLKYADTDKAGNLRMGFPANFIINQTGEIVLKSDGFDQISNIRTKISSLLAKTTK
jgi:peroxiredoxin